MSFYRLAHKGRVIVRRLSTGPHNPVCSGNNNAHAVGRPAGGARPSHTIIWLGIFDVVLAAAALTAAIVGTVLSSPVWLLELVPAAWLGWAASLAFRDALRGRS